MAEGLKSSSCKVIWENNAFVQCVVGANNCHLRRVEEKFGIFIGLRGNELFLRGDEKNVQGALEVLNAAYDSVAKGHILQERDIELLMKADNPPTVHDAALTVGKKNIYTRL